MKTSTTIALGLAALMSGSLAASAQTDHPGPAAAAAQPGEASESAPPPANQMFKPYAHPGEGDDDGLSRDPDDCMKGCIGGNPG